MILLICKRLVQVEAIVITPRGSALVLLVMLGLLVNERNANMTAAVEANAFQCDILQIPPAIMSRCNIRINFGTQTSCMAANVI
mmetsp:Transcript_19516/g.33003  ORF Transcript_19516/g.33003 Transcript_19516/m.33003 type:complete len:84 (-) Transcript_19516:824-1075(-)